MIRELVSRSPTAAQFEDLLRRASRHKGLLAWRFGQVSGALHSIGEAQAQPFAELSLRVFKDLGPVADEAVGMAFPPQCSARFEELAVELLRSRALMSAAFGYLGKCGESDEAMRAITETPVSTAELEAMRETAIRVYRSRIRER